MPAASALGVVLLGAVGFDPGLDLLALGMPGCNAPGVLASNGLELQLGL